MLRALSSKDYNYVFKIFEKQKILKHFPRYWIDSENICKIAIKNAKQEK